MTHSARSLFPDWYAEAIKAQPSSEELKKRREALDSIIKNSTTELWLKVVRIYFGLINDASPDYISVLDYFKGADEFFSVKNTHLLRVLCASAIAEKIEKEDDTDCDLLALTILCGRDIYLDTPLEDLLPLAERSWIKFCEGNRDINDEEFEFAKLKSSHDTEQMDLLVTESSTDPEEKPFNERVASAFNSIHKDLLNAIKEINNLNSEVANLKRNNLAILEEANILWWLFSGYSNIAELQFKLINPQLLAILIPLELAEMTNQTPGVGKIDGLVKKAFSYYVENKTNNCVIEEIFSSVCAKSDMFQKCLPQIPEILTPLCPFLVAVSTCSQFSETEWQSKYSQKVKLDVKGTISLERLSIQIYFELMLIRIFNKNISQLN